MLSVYCATRGAVVLLTTSLAQEGKATSLRFNALCPMMIDTDLGQRFIGSYEERGVDVIAGLSARRGRLGTVAAVAAAVFLASDEASFVNGHALPVDSGTAGRRRRPTFVICECGGGASGWSAGRAVSVTRCD